MTTISLWVAICGIDINVKTDCSKKNAEKVIFQLFAAVVSKVTRGGLEVMLVGLKKQFTGKIHPIFELGF
ncbi:hypothetical protein HZU77_003690 [Neisseriaceae bacterium TC5R-5]|nr:hypothetical protein [Neisseriaceae bacterium TC5R-5]